MAVTNGGEAIDIQYDDGDKEKLVPRSRVTPAEDQSLNEGEEAGKGKGKRRKLKGAAAGAEDQSLNEGEEGSLKRRGRGSGGGSGGLTSRRVTCLRRRLLVSRA